MLKLVLTFAIGFTAAAVLIVVGLGITGLTSGTEIIKISEIVEVPKFINSSPDAVEDRDMIRDDLAEMRNPSREYELLRRCYTNQDGAIGRANLILDDQRYEVAIPNAKSRYIILSEARGCSR